MSYQEEAPRHLQDLLAGLCLSDGLGATPFPLLDEVDDVVRVRKVQTSLLRLLPP